MAPGIDFDHQYFVPGFQEAEILILRLPGFQQILEASDFLVL
jgi:hypothetical protein